MQRLGNISSVENSRELDCKTALVGKGTRLLAKSFLINVLRRQTLSRYPFPCESLSRGKVMYLLHVCRNAVLEL